MGWTAGVLDDALGFPHADGNEDITEPWELPVTSEAGAAGFLLPRLGVASVELV